jgi:diadenosine tetraphosphate (Ap4A) HIT family hydrolase
MTQLYRDVIVEAYLPDKPATKGHVRLGSIDNLSEDDFAHVLSCASFASNVLFETVGAHGSNILLNDLDGLSVDVVMRREGDDLGLRWDPKPGDQGELEEVAARIKDKCDYIDVDRPIEQVKKPKMADSREEEDEVEKEPVGMTNYLLKKLDRIP